MNNFIFVVIYVLSSPVLGKQPPNFLIYYTDDMDKNLGSWLEMPRLNQWLMQEGLVFDNAFVTNPVCCPSRSSTLTGVYVHNHRTFNNSVPGGCHSESWRNGFEQLTFATYLKQLGYTNYHAGKYNNRYGTPDSGSGTEHVPAGWDEWVGLVGNSQYYNYTISVNGESEFHGEDYEEDYLTDLVTRYGLKWISEHDTDNPFLMILSTPAPHGPFVSAPQYERLFSSHRAPRWPNFNFTPLNHHWFVSEYPQTLTAQEIAIGDQMMRQRLQTLMSVDDLIDATMTALEQRQLLENTYVMFISDHGYHIGQFGMMFDKRTIYESDIRVPMVVRGPGVMKNTVTSAIALNIDIAPTIIELAGGNIPDYMDGRSLATVLAEGMDPTWRTDFLVEYWGEGGGLDGQPPSPFFTCGPDLIGVPESVTYCDTYNNTYSCTRTLPESATKEPLPLSDKSLHADPENVVGEGHIFCYYKPDSWTNPPPNFAVFFDIENDEYQFVNSIGTADPQLMDTLNQRTQQLETCVGVSCHQ